MSRNTSNRLKLVEKQYKKMETLREVVKKILRTSFLDCSLTEVVSSTKCNETCNPTSAGNDCGGHDGSINAYIYTVVASNSLDIKAQNFRGENVSDYAAYPVMTGEVSKPCIYTFCSVFIYKGMGKDIGHRLRVSWLSKASSRNLGPIFYTIIV